MSRRWNEAPTLVGIVALAFAAVLVFVALVNAQERPAVRLPAEFRAIYERVEACMNTNIWPPRLWIDNTVACPTTGNRRCMASRAFFPCGNVMCGASGEYDYHRQVVNLPNEYSASFAHESVHHILYVLGDPAWSHHNHWAYGCGG